MLKSTYIYIINFITNLFFGSPFRKVRILLWRIGGVKIDWSANIYPTVSFYYGAKGTAISIGKNTFCGYDVLICGGNISIGKNCDIAPRVIIHAGTHKIGDIERRAGIAYSGNITIGDGTWIGTGSTILSGANIGSGCIIAAGSVVMAGTYPNNVLLAGIPANIKKKIYEP